MKRCQVIRWFALAGPLFGAWVFLFATASLLGLEAQYFLGSGCIQRRSYLGFCPH
jgi:hypothetical protein